MNTRCDNAARLAEMFAGMAAMLAVMVVPMFSPSTIAAPSSNGIQPLAHITSVMAIVALDDCTMTVISVPTPRKISTDPKPRSV